MYAATASNWRPANLDRIQQLASAAGHGYAHAGFGDMGFAQKELAERAEREVREKERLAQERLERERREEQERLQAQRRLEQQRLEEQRLEEEQRRREEREREREAEEAAKAQEVDLHFTGPSDDLVEDEVDVQLERSAAEEERAVVTYSDDEDDDFEVIDLDSLYVNDLIIVREDFISDSEDGEELLRGQRGVIVEIDGDGDAYIRFREHRKKQWVYSENQSFLSKVVFDVRDKVVVRRSFQCGKVHIRQRQQGFVRRVDPGGDVLVNFDRNIGEIWVQYYSLVFMEKEQPSEPSAPSKLKGNGDSAPVKARMWLYNPPAFRDVAIRETPDVDGPRTKLTIRPGQKFMVSEEIVGLDGILYLKLADGSGWLFERKPDSGVLCVRQGGGLPSDILSSTCGFREQDDKDTLLHIDDAKAILLNMQVMLHKPEVREGIDRLWAENAIKIKGLKEVRVLEEADLTAEKAKRIFLDACKGLIKDFHFEVSQEGQEELIEALREHERDDTVFCLATSFELNLHLSLGSWFGMSQLRTGAEVFVNEDGPSSCRGWRGVLDRLDGNSRRWRVRFQEPAGEAQLLAPEHLSIVPNKEALQDLQKRGSKEKVLEKDFAAKAVELAAMGAALWEERSKTLAKKAPWWVAANEKAAARASTRTLEREYLALASGSEAAFAESVKREQKASPAPLAIEDGPLQPWSEMIEEIDAASHHEQVKRDFKALARRSRRQAPPHTPQEAGVDASLGAGGGGSSASTGRRRRGAFSSCAGALEASKKEEEEEEEQIFEDDDDEEEQNPRTAEVNDIRQFLRGKDVVGPRKDALLVHMTGSLEDEDPGLMAVEGRNEELPPRVTRAQAAREAFERQKARWHLPPRGKHVGYMPQAHALGAGQGNLGAMEESAPPPPAVPLGSAARRQQDLSMSSFGGLPDFDDGPGVFGGGSGFINFS